VAGGGVAGRSDVVVGEAVGVVVGAVVGVLVAEATDRKCSDRYFFRARHEDLWHRARATLMPRQPF
jgi:gas vesicle protein